MQRCGVGGFSLVEMTVVLAMVAILSVTAYVALPSASINLEYELRRVRDDLRYAQALSMATNQRYRWVRQSATTYSLVNQAGTAITLPSGSTLMTLGSGISFGSFTNLPNNLVAFDSQGAPYDSTTIPGTPLASAATIRLTASSTTRSIVISPETGYGAFQ